ncbi:MAG: cysteine desulfurase-like protein, partial [Gemmatimonadota bacterium]|nr:cysteine desulfurase-like protein [Gemmatimonadota bacterium]
GGTQVPQSVVDAMSDYLLNHNANTEWAYPTSEETDEIIAGARVALGDFLNASPHEIAFGQNMTTLTFHLSRALGREWSAGDEIIVTELDHHANSDPWRQLARDRGLTIRTVRMIPETGQLDWDDFTRHMSSRTKLVAVGAASNALGTISDVARAAAMAHDAGAYCFVDAVHYAPHELVDVQSLGCDFLACSSYKFYGPHLGALFGRHDLLQSLDVPKLVPAPSDAPENLETGTQNHEGIAGAAAAVDFFASLADGDGRRDKLVNAFAALHERGASLLERLWNGLAAIDDVKVYGPPPTAPRTPTVSLSIAGVLPIDAARTLVRQGIFASHGDFYATTVVQRLGHARDGLLRLGCACYTTSDEIDRVIAAISAIRAFRP